MIRLSMESDGPWNFCHDCGADMRSEQVKEGADFCPLVYTPGVCRFEDRRKAQSGSDSDLTRTGGMRDV